MRTLTLTSGSLSLVFLLGCSGILGGDKKAGDSGGGDNNNCIVGCGDADTDTDSDTDSDSDSDTDTDCDTVYYRDADGDDAGVDTDTKTACATPEGYATKGGDCDDDDPTVQAERTFYQDSDTDGYGTPDSTFVECHQPVYGATNADDCDDNDEEINPGATEVCDGLDNDCDADVDDTDDNLDTSTGKLWYLDEDGDGYIGEDSTQMACQKPANGGTSADADDCMDDDASVNPGASEVCNNGLDDNCDEKGTPCEISSATVTASDVKITGPATSGTYFGSGVAFSDVNGDGGDDLVVGAYGGASGAYDIGAVYLFMSTTLGTYTYLSATDLMRPGASSTYDGSQFGRSVAPAGDVGGDGYEDVVIGGQAYSSSKGYAYLYKGSSSLPTLSQVLTGSSSSDYCGTATVGGADVTGDGNDDYVTSCSGYNGGAAYIYSSTSTSYKARIEDTSTSTYGSGNALGLGDIDGDGTGDLFMGRSASSKVYLMKGPLTASGDVSSFVDDTTTGSTTFGGAIGVVGDVTGDGYEDTVIGATTGGYIRLYPGGLGTILSTGTYLTSDTYADTVATGDLNDDGVPDIVTGYPGASSNYGKVYVFYGPITAAADFKTSVAATITGQSGDYAGYDVDVGDYDHDGIDDLVLGGIGDSDAASSAGAVWIFLGGSE